MIVLMVLLTSTGMSRLDEINRRVEQLANLHTAKSNILFGMRRIVRERSLAMYSIYLSPDPFEKDEEFMRFKALAGEFIGLRQTLGELPLSAEEQVAFDEALALIQKSEPLQNAIVEDMMDGRIQDVYELMSEVDLPLERQILAIFDRLVETEQTQTDVAFAEAHREFEKAHRVLFNLGVFVITLAGLVTVFVIRRISKTEKTLFEEKEKAQVTLEAIGDGVITTDRAGRILYLNPVAEMLTGWKLKDGKGQHLKDVYTVKDEETGEATVHPISAFNIDGRVSYFKRRFILESRNGRQRHTIEDSASPIRDHGGSKIGNVIVFRDITHERELSEQLNWQAKHDALTGLANRRELELVLKRLLASAHATKLAHAFLYLDLDQFKLVNDTCGHVAGDELLKQLAVVLRNAIRKSDTVARLGGDEFGILLEECSVDNARKVARNILDTIKEFRFVWENKTFVIGVSIGLVALDQRSRDLNHVLAAADASCYLAKEKGRNCVYVHQADDQELNFRQNQMDWATRLNEALEEDRFCIYYQQVQDIALGRRSSYRELLIRMRGGDGQMISPMAFIPAAERYGMMTEIDKWVVGKVLGWLNQRDQAVDGGSMYAINLSGQSVSNEEFLKFMVDELRNKEVPASRLCLEITETAAISNWRYAIKFILTLKEMGVRFALDDFGSGMSSFAYLKNLPVDFLKIDGTFVRDILKDPIDRAMVNAINQIGHELGIKTIAEFVENQEILTCLKKLGVDYAQGYGIHVPEPLFGAENQNDQRGGSSCAS